MKWDIECDVLIVGYGAAGATAAIEAHDLGAKVLVLEKNAEGGGNTKLSGGSMRLYTDDDRAADFIDTVCEGTTPKPVIEAFVRESAKNQTWIHRLGGEVVAAPFPAGFQFPLFLPGAAFPSVPGAEAIGGRCYVRGEERSGGRCLWQLLSQNSACRQFQILNSTPAQKLIIDDENRVAGVVAGAEGRERAIKARKAVILACGGFESNPNMQRQYLGPVFDNLGNPGNTGDGIRMALQAGADLWHMSAIACTLGYRIPGFDFPVQQRLLFAGFINVDQRGRRFMNETGVDVHAMWNELTYADMHNLGYPRIPSYLIFDEKSRRVGPIARTDTGHMGDFHQWSSDNNAEIAKGWIKSANSIAELAGKVGLPSNTLQATLDKYNRFCSLGQDSDYDRKPETLVAVAQPPFYALAIWPCLLNTQGGPKRDAVGRVIAANGRVIPHLYSAGELGSLWHRFYPGSGNISEALASGRIAARNAVAETPIS